jgi:vitamin B12 transporter
MALRNDMTSRKITAAAIAGTLISLPTFANGRLEEVVITSSRVAMPLRQVGTSVSVVTADDIQARGFNSLIDVLRNQPAVAVTTTGGTGKLTSLRIRGEEGYRTLVLIDGINISDTASPQHSPRMEHLLSAGIDRVEILRGPQGLMYGADAGGVVNITTTRQGSGIGGDLSAEAGRHGTQQLAANLGLGRESFDGNLSVVDLQTDGFNARSTDTELRDDDGYENTTVHGRLGWNLTDAFRLQLIGRDVSGDNDYDGCGFPTTDDCRDEFEQRMWRASASFRTTRFSHELAYDSNDIARDYFADGAFSFASEGKLEKWSYVGAYRENEAIGLVYGVDLQAESRVDAGDTRERDSQGYYLEYQGELADRVYLTAGLRHDDNDDFGTRTTWRASGAYLIPVAGGEIKLRTTYGTGFRAPSLYEVAFNDGPWAYPPAADTSLDAETSEGYDLAVSWHGDAGLYLEAVYFDQRVNDDIYFDLVGFSGYLQDNGQSDSTGVELIADWAVLDSLSFSGNYTYNDTEQADGSQRVFRPEHLANLGITWLALDQRLRLGLNARLSHGSVDTLGAAMDDYQVVDINARYQFTNGVSLYGRVENLFDEQYEEIPTYNSSGLAAYAGVRYSF